MTPQGELVFWDTQGSGNAWKVRVVLAQLAIPHRVVRVNLLNDEAATPEYLALNPFGRVPFIRQGGFSLSESGAILCWLARGTKLLPADPEGFALVQQWICFEQNQLGAAVSSQRWLRRRQPDGPNTPSVMAFMRDKTDAALGVLDRHLAARDFLVGPDYTVADAQLYAYTQLSEPLGHRPRALPGLARWLERVASTPGFIPI